MRIMFCSTAGAGHVLPMVPLALACERRGHRVAWASASDALPLLEGFGFDRWEAGATAAVCRQQYRERWPEFIALRGEELGAHAFPRLFGAVAAPHMIDGLTRAIEACKPDVVVHEVSALAAPLVCRRLGVLNVAHAFGTMVPTQTLAMAAREFAPWWTQSGWDAPADCGLYRHLYIDIAPPSLQPGDAPQIERRQLLMPNVAQAAVISRLPEAISARLARSPDRGVIYLTFGTVLNRSELLRVAAQALARLDATIVVTVGQDGDERVLDPLPDNIVCMKFVAQNDLLPVCDAVVSHGGAGTTLAALSYGLPQLLLPQAADQFRNAAVCTAGGAAMSLLDGQRDVDRIEQAASQLLSTVSLRESARRIAREIAEMPSADDAAHRLEVECLERPERS